jgi:hypothetical protein
MSTPIEPNFEQSEFPLRSGGAALAREENLRHVRRVSNWSLAALLVGVGVTSAALAHVLPGQTSPAVYVSSTPTGGLVQARSGSGQAPSVSGPVAVSSGSQVVQGTTVGTPGTGTTTQGGVVSTGFTGKDS